MVVVRNLKRGRKMTTRLFPIQINPARKSRPQIPEDVYMAAYEVYCHVYSPQEALIDLDGRNCRGGFSMVELVGFLYAKQFPKEQWKQRYDEATNGAEI